MIEKIIYGKRIKQVENKFSVANVLRVILTFTIVNFAWIFFRLPDINDVFTVIGKIFTERGSLFIEPTLFLAIASLAIMVVKDGCCQFGAKMKLFNSKYAAVRYLSVALLIGYILLFGVLEGGQFIYFQF